MTIELTKQEQAFDLEVALRNVEACLTLPKLSSTAENALRMVRMVCRIALWTRAALIAALENSRRASENAQYWKGASNRDASELAACRLLLQAANEQLVRDGKELGELREKNEKIFDDLQHARGERDKLHEELMDQEWRLTTPFEKALNELGQYHDEKLSEAMAEPARDDPFDHQVLSQKHGMGLDSFPLTEVERILASPDMGSLASWTKIAHQAVLAMSYLAPRVIESGHAVDAAELDEYECDGDDCENSCCPAEAS